MKRVLPKPLCSSDRGLCSSDRVLPKPLCDVATVDAAHCRCRSCDVVLTDTQQRADERYGRARLEEVCTQSAQVGVQETRMGASWWTLGDHQGERPCIEHGVQLQLRSRQR